MLWKMLFSTPGFVRRSRGFVIIPYKKHADISADHRRKYNRPARSNKESEQAVDSGGQNHKQSKTQAFRNLYSFLSQVVPYQDSDLEKLFTYLRHLALKLPKRKSGPGYQFDEEVAMLKSLFDD